MKAFLSAALAATALATVSLAGAAPASAGCHTCYHPPVQYRRLIVPAEYGTVTRTVLVAPARTVWHRVPARYGTVERTVLVSPERTGYRVECGACGPYYKHYTIPARYGTVERTVLVEPSRLVAEVIPAQYTTVDQTVLVKPASWYWTTVGCGACGH